MEDIFAVVSLGPPTRRGSERIFPGTASKEKTFCNVVFDVILSACERSILEDIFAVVSLGPPPREDQREYFLILQAKRRLL